MVITNPEEVRAYLSRWELVREAEIAELRRTSLDTKLKQLEALVASRHLFSEDPGAEADDVEIWDRWSRLRRALSA